MSQGGYDPDETIHPGQGPGMTRRDYEAWGAHGNITLNVSSSVMPRSDTRVIVRSGEGSVTLHEPCVEKTLHFDLYRFADVLSGVEFALVDRDMLEAIAAELDELRNRARQ